MRSPAGSRSGRRASRSRPVAAIGSVAVLIALAALPVWSRGAQAATADYATVAITSLDPLVPRPGGTLRLAGQVTDSGNTGVDDIQVRLRLVTTPLLGRSDVAAVATGASNMQGVLVNVSVADVPRHLDPGGQAAWTISVPLADLPLGGAGVYVLVVEAVGTVNGSFQQLGLTRTFLPWVPRSDEVRASRLVWLWPLSEPPTTTPDGVLTSDGIATDLGAGGRLAEMIAAGAAAPGVVSWVVDPQVLESAAALSGGYRYLSATGVQEGRGAATAGTWLASATAVLTAGDVHALPYALPDADALVRAGLDHDVIATLTLGQHLLSAQLGRNSGPPIFWAFAGVSDRRTLDVMQSAGVRTTVQSGATLPTAPDQPYTSTGLADLPTVGGSLQAVLVDPGLAASLAMPTDTAAQIVAARQRFAAETAMVTFEDPGNPRIVVAAPQLDWTPSPALLGQLTSMLQANPWISPMTLTELLTQSADTSQRTRVEYSADNRAAELSPLLLARLSAVHLQLDALGSALSNPTKITQPFTTAILRSESSWWRLDPATGAELGLRTSRQLAAVVSRIRIVSRGTITLSGVRGNVPLTVANDFDQPVTVALVLRSNPAPRLHAGRVAPFTVPPHRKISIEVPATLAGSAPLTVEAQLVSTSGADLGAPVQLALRSTAYARAAKYVVLAAFGALVLFLVANFARRRRTAATG